MPPVAVSAPKIDYEKYRPVACMEGYLGLKVTPNGSVVPQGNMLDDRLREFLTETVSVNVSLWDGTRGIRGVPYDVDGTIIDGSSINGGLDASEIERLKELFRMLNTGTGEGESRTKRLKRDLDTHAKFFNELDPLATVLKQKVAMLANIVNADDESFAGRKDSEEIHTSLSEADQGKAAGELREAQAELAVVMKAIERGQNKASVVREELEELNSTDLRRMAVLERIFAKDPRGELVSYGNDSEELRELSKKAAKLTAERNKLFVSYNRIVKVHVDGKKGVAFLYALEGALKSMLENMKEASQPLATYSDDKENTPAKASYRIQYIKKLSCTVDATLLEVLKFAPYCGISASVNGLGAPLEGDKWWESGDRNSDMLGHDPAEVGVQNPRKTNIQPTLLPGFTKVSITSMFNTKGNLVNMHDRARVAYKAVNVAYDAQLEILKNTVLDLNSTSEQLQRVEEELVRARCQILLWCASESQ